MPVSLSRALAAIAGSLVVVAAMADGPFHCGSKIIDVRMTRAEVLQYCGAPTSKTTEFRDVRSSNNRILGTTEIHRWTYESYSATRVLVFVDERLQSIERL
jgi:Protein of unknown function (DUF2845)